MTLRISPDLELPADAVTQKFAFIGRTGSGKSYGATKLAELMLGINAQVVALDPVGVWYGLRTGSSFKVPIFGGLNGDVPLEPGNGALMADLIVDRGISAVVDVSQFLVSEQRRFAAEFAAHLFQRKKSSPSPLHLFIEEAQEFVPQHVNKGVAVMVGAFERLIKLGRNFGLGASLISQRPQAVNKDVLNQTECLFAFQMTGPQERRAIQSWVAEKGVDDGIVDALPRLRVGEPHVWSPQWLRISKTIKIAKKRTADVSATPTMGEASAPAKSLSAVDVDEIKALMAETIEKAKANDPAELRKENADLRRRLQNMVQRETAAMGAVPAAAPKKVEVPVFSASVQKSLSADLKRAAKSLDDAVLFVIAVRRDFADAVSRFDPEFSARPGAGVDTAAPQVRAFLTSHGLDLEDGRRADPARPASAPKAESLPQRSKVSAAGMGAGEAQVLTAIAQHSDGVGRDQISVLTGFKKSTRDAYIQRLSAKGFILVQGPQICVLPAGKVALGPEFRPLPKGAELRRHWMSRLPEGEARVLQSICTVYPNAIARDGISKWCGFKKSTRDAYIQRLKARRLVVDASGGVRASDNLFD